MLTLNEIKSLFRKYEVAPSKRFGQNFLMDQNVLKNILKVADIKGKDVIEIGPGLGSLTHLLLQEAKNTYSYEVDADMIKVLEGEIDKPSFHLIQGDFLKADFDWEGQRTVVANIPYYITSDILFKLFKNATKFDRAILMMQEEVADRLSAKVGSKTYGKLTVTANYFSDSKIKKEFVVKPTAFIPAPKVNSAIVSIEFSHTDKDPLFTEFVKKCFTMRRKTLYNNLKTITTNEIAHAAIVKLGFKESIRPQELTLSDFENLFKEI